MTPKDPVPVVVAIPARWASTRFPGKALADETGKPLVQHVVEAAGRAARPGRVIVATDDQRICDAVCAFGGEVVMTSPNHPNGASRIAEACDKLDIPDDAVVVNAQGDEPELDPDLIDAVVEALLESDAPMATVASPFMADEDPADRNIVKVVLDRRRRALYFSRALIPHDRSDAEGAGPVKPLKHVGLYAYRRDFLRVYAALDPTPLEETEKLEQLRMLEHGHAIAVAIHEAKHHGIDTPEQYEAFVRRQRRGD